MTFPVFFNFFGHSFHPHQVMEIAAYTAGSQLYFHLRRRSRRSSGEKPIPLEANLWLIVGCVFGALVGSKVLAWVESWPDYWAHRDDPLIWMGGKTIVGGILGGWAGVEIAKYFLRISQSTGDLFVFPLILGMCLGRVGCFLTGLDDHTCGARTNVPWAVDFGDGPRHPNQLYEILTLLLIGGLLLGLRSKTALGPGRTFRLFLLGYLTFRFLVEFIHFPRLNPYFGLSAIQIACLAAVAVVIWQLLRTVHPTKPVAGEVHPMEGQA